ncbi:hypothetical protein ACK8QS_22260 (plasmid) [Ectopseudomonas mendocina]
MTPITATEKSQAARCLAGVADVLRQVATGQLQLNEATLLSALARIENASAVIERIDAPVVRKLLALEKTDNENCRVYYRGTNGLRYCYQLESRQVFALFTCTAQGEPSIQLDVAEYAIDYAPGSDCKTASAFRAFAQRHDCEAEQE